MDVLLMLLRDGGHPSSLPPAEHLLALAESEQVLPYLLACLRRKEIILPGSEEAEHNAIKECFWWTSELKGLLQAFSTAGIDVIPLKGPVFAERVYGAAALRPCKDLDLLVRKRDFGRAASLLAENRFAPVEMPDDYHQQWHRATTTVELHFNVENMLAFDLNIDALWEHAERAEFAGVPVLRLSEADELQLMCLHGVRHRFERLSHILDIALTLRKWGTKDLPGDTSDMRPVMEISKALAVRLYPELICTASGRIEKLADQLWDTLMTEPAHTLVWRDQHQFYLELEPSVFRRSRRRVRHLRILLTRLIAVDYEWAARFGIRQKGAVWLLRQCRLIAAAINRSASRRLC